jgi:hypothetical protein
MRTFLFSSLAAIVLLPGLASAQTPGELGSLAILLGNQKVRESLSVSPSQAASLDAIRTNYRSAARKIAASEVSSTASRNQAQAALDRLTAASNKKTLNVLTPAQQAQVVKLEHKFLGATLLYASSVQKKLGLSAAQAKQISEIRQGSEAVVAKTNRLFEEGKISFHERLNTLRDDRVGRGKELLSLLTPAQRDAFAAISR